MGYKEKKEVARPKKEVSGWWSFFIYVITLFFWHQRNNEVKGYRWSFFIYVITRGLIGLHI